MVPVALVVFEVAHMAPVTLVGCPILGKKGSYIGQTTVPFAPVALVVCPKWLQWLP